MIGKARTPGEPYWIGMDMSSTQLALAAGATVASLVASVAATGFVLVRIKPDYFVVARRPLPLEGRPWALRVGARMLLNLLGLFLIIVGAALSVPGVPGQGLLTILLGVMLVELPGKRWLERAIVRRGIVHRSINRLRARFGRPPIEIPDPG